MDIIKASVLVARAQKRLGLNQTQMGAVMCVHQATVCHWRQGKGEPTMTQWATLIAYARSKGVSARSLAREAT